MMRKFHQRSSVWLLILLACGLFGTVAHAQYCLPTYNNSCISDDYINSVQFVTINNSNTGCGTPGVSNYTNYSGSLSTTVVAGVANTITVSPGQTWGQYFVAFIDLNQDQDFQDAGEFFDIGYAAGGGIVSATITIPCGSMGGNTRLRVMCQYGNTPLTQADVCGTGFSFGEVEDYGLTIQMPNYTDAGIAGFTSPVTACGMGASNPVAVSIYNCGGTVITSAQVCYTFQGGPSICENITLTLNPGGTYNHTFASTVNMATSGNYTFTASVTVPSDFVPQNNTVSNHVVTNIPRITTLPYTQNFDQNDGGYSRGGTSPSWEWGTPSNIFISAAASSPNAWVTNLDSTYNSSEVSYLTSPCFDFSALTADPFISFSHIYELPGWGDMSYLEVTTNAGSTWSKLGSTTSGGNNWYDDPFVEAWATTSGNPGQWRTADHRMTGTAGSGNVRFRFVLESDQFTEFEGVGVDNIRIRDTIFNVGLVGINSPLNGCSLGAAETVSVDITNFGTHPVNNFNVCYQVDNNPTVCQLVTTPIVAGATATIVFTTPANLSAQGPHTVLSYTSLNRDSITDNDSSLVNIVNFPVVSTFPYFQRFEQGQGNWISGGTNNDWAFGTPAKLVISGAASGQNAWVTGTTGLFTYLDNQDSWVESPCFNLSSLTNPWVTTKIWWETEDGWDGAILEYSTNGGNTWAQVGAFGDPYNWYNASSLNAPSNAGLSGDGWAGTQASSTGSGGYVLAKHDISALAGASSVRFRMRFLSDGSVTFDGIAFDDFAIAEPPVVNLGPNVSACSTAVLNPNLPTTGATFLWSNNDTTPTITVSASGSYVLQYTDSLGLTGIDTVEVSINPTPAINLGPNQDVCATTTTCFAVDSLAYPSILWSNGSTAGQICVGTSGTWSVTATDTIGCVSSSSVQTTVVPLPAPNLGPDTTLCFGQTLCFSTGLTQPNLTYLWSDGSTTPTICTSILAGYWVQVTDTNGCVGGDSILVGQGPLVPTAAITADTSGCPVVQFTSGASGQVNGYAWNFGNGNTASTQNATQDYTSFGNGTYQIVHIVQNECGADTASTSITISCLVSIDGGDRMKLSIWPNPNQGRFWLDAMLPGQVPATVMIYDLKGQMVYERQFGLQSGHVTEEVELTNRSAGVYMVRFQVGDQVKTEKLVIE